jgi:hypothetical protein
MSTLEEVLGKLEDIYFGDEVFEMNKIEQLELVEKIKRLRSELDTRIGFSKINMPRLLTLYDDALKSKDEKKMEFYHNLLQPAHRSAPANANLVFGESPRKMSGTISSSSSDPIS